jgi:hypothetical protein
MGHRINKWLQRLLVPACVIATITLLHLGFTVRWTLAILLLLFGLASVGMIIAEPGHRTKGFAEGLKSRLR